MRSLERDCRGAASIWVAMLVAPLAMVVTAVVYDTMAGFNVRAQAQDLAWALSSGAATQVMVEAGELKIDRASADAHARDLATTMDTGLAWSMSLSDTTATVRVTWDYETVLLGALGIDGWSGTEAKTSIAHEDT